MIRQVRSIETVLRVLPNAVEDLLDHYEAPVCAECGLVICDPVGDALGFEPIPGTTRCQCENPEEEESW